MKKVLGFLTIGAVILGVLTGCANNNPIPKKFTDKSSPVISKKCEISVKGKMVEAPEWVCNGGKIIKYITAVGSAPESNWGYSFQRNVALTQARAEIAREIKLKIKDMINLYESETGNKKVSQAVDGNLEQVTKSITNAMLVNSKLIDVWYAPDHTLFVLVGVPIDKNKIKKQTKRILRTSYKNEEAIWQKFQAQKAEKKLDEAIDKAFKDDDVNPIEPQISISNTNNVNTVNNTK
jgi:hypothetical protein